MKNNSKPADIAQKIIDDAGGSKISFGSIDKVNIYLPPMLEVASLLQLPSNKKQLIELVEHEYQKKLKVSRTAKYDLEGKGVGASSILKISSWLKELPISFKVLITKSTWRYLAKTLKNNSNAGIWKMAITGFRNAFSNHSNESFIELTPMFQFIEERCAIDNAFLTAAKHEIKNGNLNTEDSAQIWEYASKLWLEESFIPAEQIESFLTYTKYPRNTALKLQDKLEFLECYCHLILDFYLDLISHFELGCILYFDKPCREHSSNTGALGDAIFKYSNHTDERKRSCVGFMLDELKIRIEKLSGRSITLADLASYIRLSSTKSNSDEIDDETSLKDKKYAQLKEWRSGKTRPSPDKINEFLNNIGIQFEGRSIYPMSIYFRIALAIDNLPNELSKTLLKNEEIRSKEVENVIKKVLSRLPDYYAKNHSEYFAKEKQAV